MSEFKHTPGPWSVGTTLADDKLAIIHDGDSVMAILTTCPPKMRDARLIAAAPDLLEALEALDALWSESEAQGVDFSAAIAKARAAIAKATGAGHE